MKKALYLILAVLPLTVTPLQAQDINQAKTLVEQAQNALFSNPKQASYYAAQAAALFPEDQPNEICTQAMILHSQAEQLLGNFDLVSKIYMMHRDISTLQTKGKQLNSIPSWDAYTASWAIITKASN